ncbi:MAG: metallophosphoesterase [Alistipes sp.]|nr:metallophosphoesterase [Alistipes sp.]
MKKQIVLCILLLSVTMGFAAVPTLKKAVTGRVTSDGKPLQGVVVSDGENFSVTDAKGVFSLRPSEKAPFVFVVTPSGYIARQQQGFPQFYLPVDGRKSYDFDLLPFAAEGYELLAVGDPQPQTEEQMARLAGEVMPELEKIVEECRERNSLPEVGIILGDIVWDRMYLMPGVKQEFAKLGIPFYPVIGNHDHDLECDNDFDAAHAYRDNFGPTYYAFNLGDTYFIVLDDIEYYGRKEYDERINDEQLAWLEKYTQYVPKGSRVCVAMHAPAMKYWRGRYQQPSNRRLFKLFADYELHLLTGHTHINSNYDVAPGVVEHNVAQINGNLWHAPLNSDC